MSVKQVEQSSGHRCDIWRTCTSTDIFLVFCTGNCTNGLDSSLISRSYIFYTVFYCYRVIHKKVSFGIFSIIKTA